MTTTPGGPYSGGGSPYEPADLSPAAGAPPPVGSPPPMDTPPPRVGATDSGMGDDLPGQPLSSVGDLISDIAADLSTLVRQETELAKAEIKQSATRAGKGAGMLGGAGVAGYFVLLFLSVALWWLIGHWLGLGWSALIVAGIWAVIAAVLASMGRSELKRVQGVPRTMETAKQIPDAMKGNEDSR
jgi:hypothetical protein